MAALVGELEWRLENACAYYYKHVEVGKLLNRGIVDGTIEMSFASIGNHNLQSIDIEEIYPGIYTTMYDASGRTRSGMGRIVKTESGYCMCFSDWEECGP